MFCVINNVVGFLDSGIGGISILNACKAVLKNKKVVFLCDNKNMPYGKKTKKQIQKITLKNAKKLARLGCSIIVVACNTATVCAISYLRKKLPQIKFVGTEPNIKGPVKKQFKKIILLCTEATATHSSVVQKYKSNIQIFCPSGLAKSIESGSKDIEVFFKDINCEQFDAVIIGCTHYSFAKNQLKQLFKNAQFFDSCAGVSRQLKKIISTPAILTTKKDIKKESKIKELLSV